MNKFNYFRIPARILKIRLAIVSSILFTFTIVSLTSCNDHDDWYITPYEYKGKVTVLFAQKDGIPIKLSGSKHIFEIPSSGVLSTQAKPNNGFSHSNKFFRRLPDGTLVEMIDFFYVNVDPIIYSGAGPGIIIEDSLIVNGWDDNIIWPDLNKDSILDLSYIIANRH